MTDRGRHGNREKAGMRWRDRRHHWEKVEGCSKRDHDKALSGSPHLGPGADLTGVQGVGGVLEAIACPPEPS